MIREYFTKIASFGSIGDSILGKIIASILALPAIMFLNFISERTPDLFWALIIFLLILSIFSAIFSLKENENRFVINSFMGTMLAFYEISLNIKLALIGLVLFHVFSFAFPFLIFSSTKNTETHEYFKFIKTFGVSMFAGFAVNLFLRVALWIVK